MREPILVGVMRRHPDAEVRVITATNETGTSARGFVAEMEETIAAERDALLAKFEALAEDVAQVGPLWERVTSTLAVIADRNLPGWDAGEMATAALRLVALEINDTIKEARA